MKLKIHCQVDWRCRELNIHNLGVLNKHEDSCAFPLSTGAEDVMPECAMDKDRARQTQLFYNVCMVYAQLHSH